MKLPDEFKIKTVGGLFLFSKINTDDWLCTEIGKDSGKAIWPYWDIIDRFDRGVWNFYTTPPLTPEQLRSNAEFREQIAALDHSIRLAYQDIEHKDKLIKSYLARQSELSSKLVKES